MRQTIGYWVAKVCRQHTNYGIVVPIHSQRFAEHALVAVEIFVPGAIRDVDIRRAEVTLADEPPELRVDAEH